jgi:UDP-glucose 4-epimerase
MNHIVVTGAAGFIGSHLVDRLLRDGHRVVGIDSFTPYYHSTLKWANLANALGDPRFTLIEKDLLRLLQGDDALAGSLAQADYVFHLAAQAGVRASWGNSFRSYTDDNILATQGVLEACVGGHAKAVVYASSSSVYGDCPVMPLREDAPCRPVSPYGVTKLAGEHLCGLYAEAQGLHTVALRFFTVYGPRQRPDMAFNKFMHAMRTGDHIEVYGDGRQTRDFTFVDDIIDGIVSAPQAPRGSVINLGGGHRVTLLDALSTLAEVSGCTPRLRMHDSEPGDARDTWADLQRAHDVLGYAPRVGLRDGLAAEWEWLSTPRAC